MRKIAFCSLCLLLIGCKIVDPAGNDKHLVGTTWKSEMTDPPDYIRFDDDEGESGFYYVSFDSCYNILFVDVHFGRLIFNDVDHAYVFSDSLLKVTFPIYSAEFPNTIVGSIEERFVRSELDSAALSYCN
ncbi:hypothetical protein JNL27_10790 [bacterium]|nr:hypothetical protein [bacterium]